MSDVKMSVVREKGERCAKNPVAPSASFKLRRSERKRRQVKPYSPPKHVPLRRKRKRDELEETEEKKEKTEQDLRDEFSRQISDTLTPVFTRTLRNMNLSEERGQRRAYALKSTLKKAVGIVENGGIYSRPNGQFLVTSSDRSQTYTVKTQPLADRLHITCNCGERFDQGERMTCKHVFAVVVYSMDSIVSMYNTFSTPQSVQNMHDITGLISNMGISRSSKVRKTHSAQNWGQHDYLSTLLSAGVKKC